MIWSTFSVLLVAAGAFATPTSLNVIPTAKVLPHGQANFAVQLSGGPTSSGYLFVNQLQTELGIGDNVEFGFDASLGPGGSNLWNAKYRVYEETRRRPALAVGVLSNAGQFDNPVYITAFKADGQVRLHAGAIQISGSPRAMLGWDIWHGDAISLQADYISGCGGYASIGVVISWPNGASLNVAQLFGNSSSAPNAYMVIAGWTGKVF